MDVILAQARMTSTRLSGKCMMRICGAPMIDWIITAMGKSMADFYGVIVPDERESFNLINRCKKQCYIFAGSIYNVLERYIRAIEDIEIKKDKKIDNIIRITGDCPLLAFYPNIINHTIINHISHDNDYTNNVDGNEKFPSGLDVEVIKRSALFEAYENAGTDYEKEHVTPYIRQNKDKFKIGYIDECDYKFNTKLSVDTQEDIEKINDIINLLEMLKDQEGI